MRRDSLKLDRIEASVIFSNGDHVSSRVILDFFSSCHVYAC